MLLRKWSNDLGHIDLGHKRCLDNLSLDGFAADVDI
ncbi:MAG: hypothetical protein ACI9QQ_000078, partial [Myxococcota bacterium]